MRHKERKKGSGVETQREKERRGLRDKERKERQWGLETRRERKEGG